MEFYKVTGWKEIRKIDLNGLDFIKVGGVLNNSIIPIVGEKGEFVNVFNTEHGLVLERTEENTDDRCLVLADEYFDCSPIEKCMELARGELTTGEKDFLLLLDNGGEFEVIYEENEPVYYRWVDGKLIAENMEERKARFAVEAFQRGECKKL